MTTPANPGGTVVPVSDATYRHRVAGLDAPVLLAFTRYQHSTCQALWPVLSEVARDRADRIVVATVDVAANPATTRLWGVTEVPAMVLLHRGVMQRVLLGVRPYARLIQEIDETLAMLSERGEYRP